MSEQVIYQTSLQALLRKKQQLAELSEEIDGIESAILTDLKAGASVQKGIVTAYVKSYERVNVQWKEKFTAFVDETRGSGEGAKLAERIRSATPPTQYESLAVKIVG